MQNKFNIKHKQQKGLTTLFICLALVVSTLLVFWQVRDFDFVNYDDNEYVYENQNVMNGLTGNGIIWAFTTCYIGYWQPMTWLSLMLDYQLFGDDAGGFHLVNLFLHIANTLLLFAVLKKMTGSIWPSAFAAAAFALHPMHVESVAWIAERKDVLSTFFMFLTLTAYAGYVKHPTVYRYLLSLVLFVLGLMAKPMLVTLPFILLLLDYWPLQRMNFGKDNKAVDNKTASLSWPKLLLEKTPFLVLSIVSSVITFLTQKTGGVIVDIKTIPLADRIINACESYAKYIGKMFWPENLAVNYPFKPESILFWQFILYALLLVGVTVVVLRYWRSRKYLLVGWFWFTGTLIPVIGLVRFTGSSYADRFSYIPYTGLFIMIAWGVPELLSKLPFRKAFIGASMVIVLSTLGILAHRQVSFWRNSVALFSHAVEVTQNNTLANYNLGTAYSKLKNHNKAIEAYKRAITFKPDHYEAYYNLGNDYGGLGRYKEAAEAYSQAIKIKPDFADAYNNLGTAYGLLGRYDDAVKAAKQAIKLRPDFPDAYYNLAAAYGNLRRYKEAIEAYSQTVKLKPDDSYAYFNLGLTYLNIGDKTSALKVYNNLKKLNEAMAGELLNLINTVNPKKIKRP